MLTIKKTVDDRKVLVTRLGELLGVKPVYTRVPLCAYDIGAYRVDKEGNLLVAEEDASVEVLQTLHDEGLIEQAPELVQEETEPAFPTDIRFELPILGHTGPTLRNLINLLYTRAPLINKAMGSHFRVDVGVPLLIQEEEVVASTESLIARIAKYEDWHGKAIDGLEFKEDRICFTGFGEFTDPDEVDACMKLVSLMNKQALEQKRIMAKEVNDENEKYAFRIWLLRLGMNGDEYKKTRKTLMKNLTGHAAFRTPEAAAVAKEKAIKKREEEKAQQA